MKITLGFSPCPNDTFIFDALIHHKIDTEGLEFEAFHEDVETLNNKAFNNELDVTKLSYHALAYAIKNYILLDAGSALGFGVGPLLIANKEFDENQLIKNDNFIVAIPGKYTTANFLLGFAYPKLKNKQEFVFSEIEQKIINNEIDLGLIIHENRFTYQDKGLKKILDLGDFWEKETGCAIPLGGIVVNRNLPIDVQLKINRLIRKSVEYAFENPKSGLDFIKSHAQEMSEEVMYKHINLYVNQYSIDLGKEGRKAITTMFEKGISKGIFPEFKEKVFLTNLD